MDLNGLVIVGPDGVKYRLIKISANSGEADFTYPKHLDVRKFGEDVRQKRVRAGLTQEEFAVLVPMTQSQLSLVEKGDCKPRKITYLGIMRALQQIDHQADLESA